MANVYISVLGTNDYLECTYCLDNEVLAADVRFVQEATIQHACKAWDAADRILVLTTEEALKKNWFDDGHRDPKTGKVLPREGLKTRLAKLSLRPTPQSIPIPEGRTENEIWQIFETIYDQIHPGDHIVFDITHGFRSLPMLALVVLHYAKALKKVSLEGIYYGAFEVLGPPHQVRSMPPEQRRAPVFDLTAFDTLLDWSLAIDRFVETGDARLACKLASERASAEARRLMKHDEGVKVLRRVSSGLDAFSKAMATCRGLSLSDAISQLKANLDSSLPSNLIPAFVPLLEQLKNHLAPFTGDHVPDGIRAARWCAEHNLIQQGYTILREFIISYAAELRGGDPKARDDRKTAESYLQCYAQIIRDAKKRGQGHEGSLDTPQLTYFKECPGLVQVFYELADPRNDLNHAGMRKDPKSARTFYDQLPKLIDKVERVVIDEKKSLPPDHA